MSLVTITLTPQRQPITLTTEKKGPIVSEAGRTLITLSKEGARGAKGDAGLTNQEVQDQINSAFVWRGVQW